MLRAGDPVAGIRSRGAGRHVGGIGARAGFGEGEGTETFAGRGGQIAVALGFVAAMKDRIRRQPVGGNHRARRAAGAGNRGHGIEQHGRAQAEPAIGFRNVQAHQPHFRQAVEVARRGAAGLVDPGGGRREHLAGIAADRLEQSGIVFAVYCHVSALQPSSASMSRRSRIERRCRCNPATRDAPEPGRLLGHAQGAEQRVPGFLQQAARLRMRRSQGFRHVLDFGSRHAGGNQGCHRFRSAERRRPCFDRGPQHCLVGERVRRRSRSGRHRPGPAFRCARPGWRTACC